MPGFFVVALDAQIINVALPEIRASTVTATRSDLLPVAADIGPDCGAGASAGG